MDGANWQGNGGILVRLLEHLSVTALAPAAPGSRPSLSTSTGTGTTIANIHTGAWCR